MTFTAERIKRLAACGHTPTTIAITVGVPKEELFTTYYQAFQQGCVDYYYGHDFTTGRPLKPLVESLPKKKGGRKPHDGRYMKWYRNVRDKAKAGDKDALAMYNRVRGHQKRYADKRRALNAEQS